jgi:hypothetical protein
LDLFCPKTSEKFFTPPEVGVAICCKLFHRIVILTKSGFDKNRVGFLKIGFFGKNPGKIGFPGKHRVEWASWKTGEA